MIAKGFVTLMVALLCLILKVHASTARDKLFLKATSDRKRAASQPHPFRKIPVFDVASPRALAGTGFMVSHQGKVYAVTAKHPHGKADPTHFTNLEKSYRLKDKVYDGNDILVFAVAMPDGSSFQVARSESRMLREGDVLAVVSHDGALSGTLISWNLGMDGLLLPGQAERGSLNLKVAGNHDLQGMSGAPIVLEQTGEVVGILTHGYSDGDETHIRFSLLNLEPPPVLNSVRPTNVFSLEMEGNGTVDKARVPGLLFPSELFECVPNMPLATLLENRPFLSNVAHDTYRGRAHFEIFDSRYLFREAEFSVNHEKRVWKIEFERYFKGPSKDLFPRVHSMFDWFFASLGRPSEAFAFGEWRNQPGSQSVFCQWSNTQATVIVGAMIWGQKNNYTTIRVFSSKIPRGKILQPSWTTMIPSDLHSLRKAIRKISRGPDDRQ